MTLDLVPKPRQEASPCESGDVAGMTLDEDRIRIFDSVLVDVHVGSIAAVRRKYVGTSRRYIKGNGQRCLFDVDFVDAGAVLACMVRNLQRLSMSTYL
jgi:hypothetical protein